MERIEAGEYRVEVREKKGVVTVKALQRHPEGKGWGQVYEMVLNPTEKIDY